MPVITLTDLAIRHLKPETGKQVTYLDKSLKGFGVRVGAESMTYILIYGPNRTRVKLGAKKPTNEPYRASWTLAGARTSPAPSATTPGS
jgi:hypothetical protein